MSASNIYQPFIFDERLIFNGKRLKRIAWLKLQKAELDSLNYIRNCAIIVLDKTIREMENNGEERKSQAGKSR